MYHLSTHPNVIRCCKDDIFNVGCSRYITLMSMRKEAYQKSKASPSKLVSYRFVMIPKEVHNMENTLKIKNVMSEVDWSLMMQDAYEIRDLGKVAIFARMPKVRPNAIVIDNVGHHIVLYLMWLLKHVNLGLLQMGNGRKHIVSFCCVSSMQKNHGWTTCCPK